MEKERTRVNNPWRYVSMFPMGSVIRVGVPAENYESSFLHDLGFTIPLVLGEKVLPDARVSKSAFENSEGKRVVRKDLPMEVMERYWEWSWKDWQGTSYSDFKYIPYNRYVREILQPELIELTIAQSPSGSLWIVSDEIVLNPDQHERLKLAFNLVLSIFKDFYVVDKDIKIPLVANKTCSWEILRPGENAIDVMHRIINERIHPNKQNMYYRNTNILMQHNPSIVAIGMKGFGGYFVFEYPNRKHVILESLMPDNATYILGKDWEEISKLTKREVLSYRLHTARIYHNKSWDEEIMKYIPQ